MQKSNWLSHACRVSVGVLATGVFLAAALAATAGSSSAQGAGQAAKALRIDVTLNEYSFSPEPLRIPAGRPVTLVITNVGQKQHEFMAGRHVQGNDFAEDLFADLHVNIEPVEMADAGHEGQSGHAGEEHAEAPGHAEGHTHGTMVENQPGETVLMSFTLPESRRGEWSTGCFLPGHYDAGMHGTLIVE